MGAIRRAYIGPPSGERPVSLRGSRALRSGAPESGRRQVSRALGWSAASSLLVLGINAATGILLARDLGPASRGALAAALLWPSLLGGLGVFGLLEAVSVYVARRQIPQGEVLGSALLLGAAASIVVILLTAVVLQFVLGQQTSETVSSAYIYLAYIPINIFVLIIAGYLNGRQRFRAFQTLRVAVVAVAAVGLFSVAVIGHLSVRLAVFIYLAAGMWTLGLAAIMAGRIIDERLRATRATSRVLLAFGVRSFASTAAWRSNERLDQPVIAAFLPPAQLGLYVTAVTLSSLASLVGASVVYVGVPTIAAEHIPARRRRLASALVSLTLGASILLTVPLVFGAHALLGLLFGSQFQQVATVAQVLLVASVVLSVNRAIESVLTGAGRPSIAAKAELWALPVTAVGLAALLPTVGLIGAAWASLAAYVFAFAMMSRRAGEVLGLPWHRLLVPYPDDLRALFRSRALGTDQAL